MVDVGLFSFQAQRSVAQILVPHFAADGLVPRCLQYAEGNLDHIMDFTKFRALNSLFSMINQSVRHVQQYNQQHSDFPMPVGVL